MLNYTMVTTVIGDIKVAPEDIRDHVGEWVVDVHCPYCGAKHQHSAPKGPGVDPGFRIAHCRLDRQGYMIVTKASEEPQP